MVDVEDVQGYRNKLENQLQKLADADIDDRDRDAIKRFVVHLRTNDSTVDIGTVVGHLNRLRLAAERSQTPLADIDSIEDANAIDLVLEDEYGLSEGTIRNYRKALRKFFAWRGDEWADEYKVGSPIKRPVDPDEALDSDEIDAMLDAAPNPRDKALVAILADAGVRIGAALSFQMRHVNITNERATLTINEDANVKQDEGKKPLSWSRGYVANWIDVHPRPDDPDAALIHKMGDTWDEDEHGALAQQYASSRIRDIAADAGLGDDRVEARLLRSSAITQWIKEDLGEQAIKHRTGWSKDSRMFEIYSRVRDEEMNDLIFEHYGIESDSDGVGTPDLDQCNQCRTPLRGHERFCPGCASPLGPADVEAVEEIDDSTFGDVAEADGYERDYFAEFRNRFNSNPEFRKAIIAGFRDAQDDPS